MRLSLFKNNYTTTFITYTFSTNIVSGPDCPFIYNKNESPFWYNKLHQIEGRTIYKIPRVYFICA